MNVGPVGRNCLRQWFQTLNLSFTFTLISPKQDTVAFGYMANDTSLRGNLDNNSLRLHARSPFTDLCDTQQCMTPFIESVSKQLELQTDLWVKVTEISRWHYYNCANSVKSNLSNLFAIAWVGSQHKHSASKYDKMTFSPQNSHYNSITVSLLRSLHWLPVKYIQSISRLINQTSIAPISPAKPGSVARQLNQCSTPKLIKQFRNTNRPWGVTITMGERPSQRSACWPTSLCKRNNLFNFAPWLLPLFHHARWNQTEESLCPPLGSRPTLAQGHSALTPLSLWNNLPKTSENIPFRLGLPPPP